MFLLFKRVAVFRLVISPIQLLFRWKSHRHYEATNLAPFLYEQPDSSQHIDQQHNVFGIPASADNANATTTELFSVFHDVLHTFQDQVGCLNIDKMFVVAVVVLSQSWC